MEASTPVRSVLITAATLGLKLEKLYVNVIKKEQLMPELIKVSIILTC